MFSVKLVLDCKLSSLILSKCIIKSFFLYYFKQISPRFMSPISFFFGPFPKLLLRDQEKKIPRFLSALSSLLSSFSDFPDLCFLMSCEESEQQFLFQTVQTRMFITAFKMNPQKESKQTLFGVERLERSELALCLDGAGLQGIW